MSRSSSTPSNHASTALYLKQIKKIQVALEEEKIYPVDMIASMAALAETPVGAASRCTTNQIQDKMGTNYENEFQFDRELFQALRHDLLSNDVTIERNSSDENSDNLIVLTDSICETLAYGFARQARANHLFSTPGHRMASTVVDSEVGHGILDHVSCIFEKHGDEWKIKEILSVVELNMSNSSCTLENRGDILSKGPMIQEVAYALETAWPSICRAGVGAEVTHLPLAVIAAQKQVNGNIIQSVQCRWAKGRILVPEVCGGAFKVQLNSFGTFGQNAIDHVRYACGLYLETLLFGYKLCKVYMSEKSAIRPSPLSGQKLFFGTVPVQNAELRGTPLLFDDSAMNCFSMSQGEIFFASEVDLNDAKDCVWLSDHRPGTFRNVYFKVWSSSVHKFWHEPPIFFQDIEKLSDKVKLAHFENTVNDQANRALINAVRELSKVYIGVWKSSTVGTVSLMYVVEKSKEIRLKKNDIGELGLYWKCLMSLVRTVLLPLARAGFVHSDIRSGFDITANILLEDGPVMRLIDLESICTMNSYIPPSSDCRYPMVEGNSFTFVAAQCIGIVYAWLCTVDAKDVDINTAIAWASSHKKVENPKPTNETGLERLMEQLDQCVTQYVQQQQSV